MSKAQSESLQASKLREQIQDAGTLKDQVREVGRILPLLEHKRTELETRSQQLATRFQEECERRGIPTKTSSDTFTIETEHRLAHRMLLGTGASILLHSAFSAYSSFLWFAISPEWAIGIGLIVGVLISLMCKNIALEYLYDPQSPRPTRRLLQRIVLISFSGCLTCLASFMATRNPSPEWVEIFILVMNGSLAVLELLLPIFAGARLALAYDFEWSHRYDQEYRTMQQQLAELNGFMEWARDLLPHASHINTLLPFALVLGSLFGTVVQAQSLQLWMDDTSSIASDARQRGVESFRPALTPLINKENIKAVEVFHFTHQPWLAKSRTFLLPHLQPIPCPELDAARQQRTIFKAGEQLLKKAEAKCQQRQNDARRDYEQMLEKTLDNVIEAMLVPPQQRAGCTAVYDLLGRIATSRQTGLVIIFSDAVETCQRRTTKLAIPISPVKTILLLLPTIAETRDKGNNLKQLQECKARLSRLAPWVRVEPFFSESLVSVFD